jgi:hypothetical protein
MTMDLDLTSPTAEIDILDVVLDQDRAASERALEAAQRNPILSGEQACAVAQVHALLAIERRLSDLIAALVTPSDRSDRPVTRIPVAVHS